jgi:quinone-modifying oxidoreductase subunit QmoB
MYAQVASSEMNMACKTHEALCSAEGRALIEGDMNDGVNTVVVAACSPRVMLDEFNFGDDKIVIRANLREQVVWSKGEDADPEYLQEEASDYMRMACTQADKSELPDPFTLDAINKNILVMGGGVAGLTAAKEAAATGYDVTLVEKSDILGGKAVNWRQSFPTKAPWSDMEAPIVDDLIQTVQDADNITVKTATEVARIFGAPGDYKVTFKEGGTTSEWDAPAKVGVDEQDAIDKGEMEDPNAGLKHYMDENPEAENFGAVVLATGWTPADVSEYEHLSVGSQNVITNAEFEAMAGKGKITRPSDGKPAESVVFVQSPGGAEHDKDFPYCNSVTSLVALKQAKYVRDDNPDAKAYILYQHMRTPGNMELFYKSAQQDDGIFLTKANVTKVEEGADGSLTVEAEDTLLNDNLSLDADIVVLAAGALIDLDLFDGYADSHFICFPYETRRTGVYACGGVRKATTIDETIDDATGAALKAIQCLESADRGVAVHPRSGDKTYPEFFMQRCTQCKRCTEECPFGAIDDDEKGTPLPNPTRCRRCGTCMGACPERIIGFKDYNVDMIGSMVKAIEVPDDDEDKLRFVVFVCENDAYPAIDMAAMRRLGISNLVRIIPVRCLGSVNVVWIKDAMSAGMDGAMLLGCQYGDDYQCHFVKGSELADKRMDNVAETMGSLGLEVERVAVKQVAINEYHKIPEIINEFVEEIVEMGPNPFKGF